MVKEIRLVPEYGEEVTLKLYKEKKPYTVEEILSVEAKVYEDLHYYFVLEADEVITDAHIMINDADIDAVIVNNQIQIKRTKDYKGTFADQIGFIQISLRFPLEDDEEQMYYSDYASVLIRSSKNNKAIDSMLKYVYENQEDILKTSTTTIKTGKDLERSYDDFWSQIMMLRDIADIYESCFGFFMTNSRQRLELVEVVDRVEKLQFVDSKTINYIVSHPEYLKKETAGLRFGKQYFLPSKTSMLQNRMTKNIYENQVVLGFLEKVFKDTEALKKRIEDYIKVLRIGEQEESGYIESSYLLYVNAKEIIEEFKLRIDEIYEKIEYLYMAYSGIFEIEAIDCTIQPRPTPIFMSVPQYNMVYTCIMKWFGKTGYDFERELIMMNFLDAPTVYEAYVLLKLVNQIKELGFKLIEIKNVKYPRKIEWFYHNKEYCNTYEFEKDGQILTLYYEPLIYDEPRKEINGISLYRNNTTSLNKENNEEWVGHYYVPDFLIKTEINGQEKYVICDAKYTYLSNAKNKFIPDLSYKYLFSISDAEENTEIIGMTIFYGLTDENTISESFYDKEQGRTIKPFADLVPLSEFLSTERQKNNILNLIRKAVKR